MSDINGAGQIGPDDDDLDLNEEFDGSELDQDELDQDELDQDELNQEELTLDEDEEPSGE